MAERARRGKSRKNGGPIGHNQKSTGVVSDELYQRWMKKIEDGMAAVERAAKPLKSRKGELGAIFKAAKADGVDCDAIREAFALDKLDHLDVAAKYANTGRVLRLMESSLGVQMELFRVSDFPVAVTAAIAGRRAGSLGHDNENPHTPGSEAFVAYDAEYRSAQEALAEQFR